MIQDIAPHKFDNTYRPVEPQEDSFVLFFRDGELLVIREKDEDCEITFPTYGAVKELTGELRYLMELDGRRFFREEKRRDLEQLQELYPGKTVTYENRTFFRTVEPKEYALAAITGMHLNGWYEKSRYCGACGGNLEHDEKERMMRCPVCGNMVFPRINPAVIVAVTDGERLLMTKYRGRTYKKYALVAGFVEIGESMEATVEREVLEETGVKVKNIRYYKSQPWGFTDNILAGYVCDLDGDGTIRMDKEELAVAEWVERTDIDVEEEDLSLTNEMMCAFRDGKL